MSELDDQLAENLGREARVHQSIAAKIAAHQEKYPAIDTKSGRPIPADEWAKRKIYNGATYLGRADELGVDG